MSFERLREPPGVRKDVTASVTPTQCPECRSKSVGTLSKTITPETYWRCQSCGAVWNETRSRQKPHNRW